LIGVIRYCKITPCVVDTYDVIITQKPDAVNKIKAAQSSRPHFLKVFIVTPLILTEFSLAPLRKPMT